MAVTSGTVTNVFNVTAPLGPKRTTAGLSVFTCFITVNVTGTYDQAANSQCLAVTNAISSALHNGGKTIALLGACFASFGDEAGVLIGAKTVAVSGTGLTFELTTGDGSTEHAAAALGVFGSDICFAVTYTES